MCVLSVLCVQFASPMYFFDSEHLTEPRILIYYYCPVNSRDSPPPSWIYRCALPCLAFTWVPRSLCFCGRHSAERLNHLPSPEKINFKLLGSSSQMQQGRLTLRSPTLLNSHLNLTLDIVALISIKKLDTALCKVSNKAKQN